MPTRKISSNKSSRRRLNTGSALTSRQEVTPASAEVGSSTSSTPSVSLRGDAESAEVSSSLSGQPIMNTRGSVVPSQPILVEPRINKRRDCSPSETSDGQADNSRWNPFSDRGKPFSDRGNPSNSNRGNPSDQESPVDFLDSAFTASAEHSMSLKDITQPRASHQVVYHKGHPTSNALLLYHDTKREVVQQCIANLLSQFHDHYEHVEVIADSYKGIFEDKQNSLPFIPTTLLNVCGVRIVHLRRDIPSSSIWNSHTHKYQLLPTKPSSPWLRISDLSLIWMTSV